MLWPRSLALKPLVAQAQVLPVRLLLKQATVLKLSFWLRWLAA